VKSPQTIITFLITDGGGENMIRKADASDNDFLVQIDIKNEGVTSTSEIQMTEEELRLHRKRITSFVTDKDKGGFIYADKDSQVRLGMIMYSIVNRDEEYPWKTVYQELDRTLFQEDGRFLGIYQLWVNPNYRRAGIATKLKLKVEDVARANDINLIYTHTEERNSHVIELNKKLGYKEVRRGPIWDDIVRVSLIKYI
jgi:ribosomal protein S18 acetylase RimI-like enzyme